MQFALYGSLRGIFPSLQASVSRTLHLNLFLEKPDWAGMGRLRGTDQQDVAQRALIAIGLRWQAWQR
ncbi:hypothetical protein BKD09_15235 [Bradyrhizobium japonicum]|uniref:Uncharacterized protein n=1 Tax=Bradyrhizobium japonicum TaxID=375 RepID=A0A1L3F8R8_BRAJP|nr:hypothetical protein BKD09_15235 [Bradyrhizobium japonicum]